MGGTENKHSTDIDCSPPPSVNPCSDLGSSACSKLSSCQGTRIQQLLSSARFTSPDGACLSPAGEYNLRLGIMKVGWCRLTPK
jgi:hypothetical protein